MSSVYQRSEERSPPSLVCVLMLLDPRRWAGVLIAIFGILVVSCHISPSVDRMNTFLRQSIVAPFLTSFLPGRILAPAAVEEEPSRHVHIPRRPQLAPTESIIVATNRVTRTRSRTSGDAPSTPHVTFSFDPHPRVVSTSSLIATSSQSVLLQTESSPSHPDSRPSSPPLSSSSSTTSLLPPASPMPYIHPLALPSLESLDIAIGVDSVLDIPSTTASPNTKHHFRVQMPKLGFGKRPSTGDSTKSKSNATIHAVAPAILASDSTAGSRTDQSVDADWHGNRAFAVRRNSTITSLPATPAPRRPSSSNCEIYTRVICLLLTLPIARRKFSIFSRESPLASKGKDLPVDAHTVSPPSQAATPPSRDGTALPIPELPSPATLKSMATSLPPNAVAGPSHSRAPSFPPPRVDSEIWIPLKQTTTPPARPTRTDPYKLYGVPVPGSDRARAFLKAERKWIRAEKERKDRERAIRGEGIAGDVHEESVDGHGENVRGWERQIWRRESSKTIKDSPAPAIDPGGEGGAVDGTETMGLNEFGVLPVAGASVTSASPQEQNQARSRSSQGRRRSWVFPHRHSETAGEKEKRREKKEKGKVTKESNSSKSKGFELAKSTARPKSRDGPKISFGFRSKGRARSRDRGYSSDTGVPSLTYKLM